MSIGMLANWIFYVFMGSTLIAIVYSFFRRNHSRLSIISLLVWVSIPYVSFQNMMKQTYESELEYLLSSFMEGSLWAVYVIFGYLFLVVSWIVFFIKK